MDKLKYENIQNVCRLCLKSDLNLIDLLDGEDESKKILIDNIFKFSKIKLKKNDPPTKICVECQTNMNVITNFVTGVHECQRKIANILKEQKTKNNPKRSYECFMCRKQFSRNSNCRRHVKDAHRLPEFLCICGSAFTRADRLKRHQGNCVTLKLTKSNNARRFKKNSALKK